VQDIDLTPQFPVLIGDIGGTNARFAVVAGPGQELRRFAPVRISEFASIADAMRRIAGEVEQNPRTMVLAIATPLVGERFRLTNGDWTIDPRQLIGEFGLEEIVLMNDFAAQALAVLALDPAHVKAAGGPQPVADAPKVVIGPGTGLGIAFLARVGGRWTILPGEGGHIDIGPRTAAKPRSGRISTRKKAG
jgi:glucokinase